MGLTPFHQPNSTHHLYLESGSDSPIGVIDSGLGGLSVVAAIQHELPRESIIYYADTAYCPYGTRDVGVVLDRLLAITRELVDSGVKMVVLACNTGTAIALEALRAAFPIPIVGLEPAVKPAAALSRTGRIAVVATPRTVSSSRLDRLVERHARDVVVERYPAPDWVDLVESGHTAGLKAERQVRPIVEEAIAHGCDVMVLGCTHFSFLRGTLDEVADGSIQFIDSGPAVARRTASLLLEYDLHTANDRGDATLEIRTSGSIEAVEPLCRRMLAAD